MMVALVYRLYDEAGELRDTVRRGEPLRYLHGYAQILPGLERGIDGARIGERRRIELLPEVAFGERDESAMLEIDKDDFPGGSKAAVGDEIIATAPDGSECGYRIVAITGDELVVDRNHPLAGQRVRFDVEVADIRPARDAEIAAAQRELDARIVADPPAPARLVQIRDSR